MRAAVLREDSFTIEDIPSPVCDGGATRLKVLGCGLNHRDLFIKMGQYAKITYPAVLGSDVCGITDDGERVMVDPSLHWGPDPRAQGRDYQILGMPTQGGMAEEVCVPTENLYPVPEHLSDEEASCYSISGVTAYRALFVRGDLQQGQTVLITGIGGGVATHALVFAAAAGARILVSSRSEAKLKRAAEYGADPVDLKRDKSSIDLIVDGIGGSTLNDYLDLVVPGGRIVVYGATVGAAPNINLHRIFWKQINLLGTTMGTPRNFSSMVEFITRHQIRPIVDSVYSLDNFADAFTRMQNADQFGKIVIRP
ncbi:MAG: alcohol dehydrogenase [Chlorobi bacterium]|nr:MAG: zinc-binding dehydrogenase [Bacteroidota bacterium]KXK32385.1 MAG: NADPH:quinone reductase-like protein [Chlorobi bacterium OLB6]MBE2266130.1 zinc-binding dehydrogenase [Flavobacteriales bacterium]MBL1161751.1 alcohol dehydrogenase [Chlorobiota bacterium]MBW7853856.1 zinc-binding dehydrogenase [Candidatus Kapabacteria bacterium]MCC6331948.1 zinc-binding dehydrogenase [Ignavibacteria bacterium]